MNQYTLNEIQPKDLITISKELIHKIIRHDFENPDAFALYGYSTILLLYAKKLNLPHNERFFNCYNNALSDAVASVVEKRDLQNIDLHELGQAIHYLDDLNKSNGG